jgi:hypothetical protein
MVLKAHSKVKRDWKKGQELENKERDETNPENLDLSLDL